MKRLSFLVFCIITLCASAEKNVLFIGNSYTYVNDLPSMINAMASSTNDTINVASNTPGACRFSQHVTNMSMTLIQQGGWDLVVLQEQSQLPSFPMSQVSQEVFPFAEALVDSIYANNICPEPMFYMTWGHKKGDADNAVYYPPLSTYEGMDSLLRERYLYMGKTFDASVCPVGKVWHYIRHNHPKIELYQNDNSHPTIEGSYAAACAFYTMILHKDPTLIRYTSTLDTSVATTIRNVTKQVVYDSLAYWQRPQPEASFTYNIIGNFAASFTCMTEKADTWLWNFGDGTDNIISDSSTIVHTFPTFGTYNVQLIISKHCKYDTLVLETEIIDSAITTSIHNMTVEVDSDAIVTIYDAIGRLIYKGIKHNAPYTSLTPGIYFINRKKIIITK